MKTPSTKVSLIFLITVILVTGTIILFNKKENSSSFNETNSSSISLNIKNQADQNSSLDSDGDGLLDWEESLWGTDQNNPDTDGDGTNDKEEIEINRDPTLPGPDDERRDFKKEIIEELKKIEIEPDGVTNKVVLDLINNYFTLRQNGNLDQETKNNLIAKITQNVLNEIVLADVYTGEFTETFNPRENNEKVLVYVQNILKIQEELSLIASLNNGDPKKVSDEMKKSSQKIISLEVPESLLEENTQLANLFNKMAEIIKNIDKEEKDPLLAFFMLSLYQEVDSEILTINEQIGLFARESGIINLDGEFKTIKND